MTQSRSIITPPAMPAAPTMMVVNAGTGTTTYSPLGSSDEHRTV